MAKKKTDKPTKKNTKTIAEDGTAKEKTKKFNEALGGMFGKRIRWQDLKKKK